METQASIFSLPSAIFLLYYIVQLHDQNAIPSRHIAHDPRTSSPLPAVHTSARGFYCVSHCPQAARGEWKQRLRSPICAITQTPCLLMPCHDTLYVATASNTLRTPDQHITLTRHSQVSVV